MYICIIINIKLYYMETMNETIKRWIATAIKNESKYIISVCDTFDYDDYPVYCKDKEECDLKYDKIRNGGNMQTINEVIDVEKYK